MKIPWSRTSKKKGDPCTACFGRGEVVFDEENVHSALVSTGYDVVRVSGEAILVCPSCGGGGYE